jgi:heptosyltransferase III
MAQMAEPVLVYRIGSIGDAVISLPCFHKISRCFPDSVRVVLTNHILSSMTAPVESVLQGGGFIHSVVRYSIGTRDPAELRALARAVRAIKAKQLIYIGGNRGLLAAYRDLVFFRFCGFSKIIGLPLSAHLDCIQIDPATGEYEHEANRLVRCLRGLGKIDLNDASVWNLRLQTGECVKPDAYLSSLAGEQFIAVNTGGKLEVQDWGEERWMTMLGTVGLHVDAALVFVGGVGDYARATRLARIWPGSTLNSCGQFSPRECGRLLGRASLFVGHDTGPLHIAAASQIPCVAIFGSNNKPRQWHPYGPHHRVIHDVSGIERISPLEVASAVIGAFKAAIERNGKIRKQ